MGTSISVGKQNEMDNWENPHELTINSKLRVEHLANLRGFGRKLQLCSTEETFAGMVKYNHWFVTDGVWVFEFACFIPGKRFVKVHNDLSRYVIGGNKLYVVHQEFRLTRDVKQRMKNVSGATNHSILLRNCEHVARYVYSGNWISFQTAGGGGIREEFKKILTPEAKKLINTPPKEVDDDLDADQVATDLLYPECKFMVQFCNKGKCLESASQSGYNVLFLGPTGSGKSRLINLLFNKEVSKSAPDAQSVTKDVVFLEGLIFADDVNGYTGSESEREVKSMNVIDTIGLCDSFMSKKEVYDCVKDKLETNVVSIDIVVVVCYGRIEGSHTEAINQYLDWLHYKDHPKNFVFVYNKAENLTVAEREKNLLQMGEMLDVNTTNTFTLISDSTSDLKSVELAFTTGFPPGARYDQIENDREKLVDAILSQRKNRIKIHKSSCVIL